MEGTLTQSPLGATVSEFASLPADQFRQQIDRRWEACRQVFDRVSEVVEQDDAITPLVGLGIVACVTGQVFSYPQLHGEARPADLTSALLAGISNGSDR